MLESLHDSPDPLSGPNTDIVELSQFSIGNPPQIAKATVAGSYEGFQHGRFEPDLVLGQVLRVIQLNIHPVGSARATRTNELAQFALLAGQESDLVSLSGQLQKRLFNACFEQRILLPGGELTLRTAVEASISAIRWSLSEGMLVSIAPVLPRYRVPAQPSKSTGNEAFRDQLQACASAVANGHPYQLSIEQSPIAPAG